MKLCIHYFRRDGGKGLAGDDGGGGGDACTDAPKGDPCDVDGDCCSGICKNNGTCR